MSDTIPQSVSNGCRKYVKSRIIINTFNTFNNVNSNSIMQNVEDLVCRRVNGLMSERCKNGKGVTSDNVYEGKKNIPFVRIVARSFIFDLLHNRFGFSYSVISQRSGMNVTSVMRNVRKCHELVERDKSYQKISEEIDGELLKM